MGIEKLIFYVEDDELVYRTMIRAIRSFGFEVVHFTDYDSALVELSSKKEYFAMLLDNNIPPFGAKNGSMLGYAARDLGYVCPITILSAGDQRIKDALAKSGIDFLPKPSHLTTIESYLKGEGPAFLSYKK